MTNKLKTLRTALRADCRRAERNMIRLAREINLHHAYNRKAEANVARREWQRQLKIFNASKSDLNRLAGIN